MNVQLEMRKKMSNDKINKLENTKNDVKPVTKERNNDFEKFAVKPDKPTKRPPGGPPPPPPTKEQ